MHIVIFAVLAFTAGMLAVLAPRPIPRTAFVAALIGLIFGQLGVELGAYPLSTLAVVLLVVDLLFFREPKAVDDIGDRQTASATLDDDWHLVALARTGDSAAFYLDRYLAGENPAITDDVRSVVRDLQAASDKAQGQLIKRGGA